MKDKTDKPLNVLVSAYACGPNWGSEIGMGWNWVVSLSEYCKLHVLTEVGFKKDIEERILTLGVKYEPNFYYVDIGDKGRKLFWKQGSFLFYKYYRTWQKDAYKLALTIVSRENIDLIHQLNMIGYREPGYLWKIKSIPYVIGPLGGYIQYPFNFFSILSFRDKLFYSARSIINYLQMHLMTRPKKAYKRADQVILATASGMNVVSKYTHQKPIVMTETGSIKLSDLPPNIKPVGNRMMVTWVGIVNGRKALKIAIQAVANSKHKNKLILNVIGDGPNLEKCKCLANKLKLENIVWHGKIPNENSKKIIAESNLLFFTSVLDATSTVIFEALQEGIPVLCHDYSGFGFVIKETCGIKIPLVNPKHSIKNFSEKIDFLVENPSKLQDLQRGCRVVAEQYNWNKKANAMNQLYIRCLTNKKIMKVE